MALPQHEFGLDVVVLVGTLRHRDHRSVPEIHAALSERGVEIAERSVTNLLDRYGELLATSPSGSDRRQAVLARQGRVILALDGLQPDVGHEVLWVVRDCLSGEVLLARSLPSGTAADLPPLSREVADAVRRAGHRRGDRRPDLVAAGRGAGLARGAPPVVPVPLPARGGAAGPRGGPACQEGVEEAGARGVRRIERAAEGRGDAEAEVVRGYAAAVRSAITDDGRAPLAAPRG